jgi:predicted RNA binding protein YcfA (HicA-like mRNA interferase family)
MSSWPLVKAKRLMAALTALDWRLKRQVGYHRILEQDGWPDFVFSFHDGEEIGPRMLARIAKHAGLTASDL